MNTDCKSIRLGQHEVHVSQLGALLKIEIDRNVDSPVFRETIQLVGSPGEMRDLIALLAASLELKPETPAHVTRLHGICQLVRERFTLPLRRDDNVIDFPGGAA